MFPTLTNVERPMPSALAWFITARPSAPDCDMNPTLPAGGHAATKVPFRRTSGSVLAMPMQLGPIRRMPNARQVSTSVF